MWDVILVVTVLGTFNGFGAPLELPTVTTTRMDSNLVCLKTKEYIISRYEGTGWEEFIEVECISEDNR